MILWFLGGLLQLITYLLNSISVAHVHIYTHYDYKIIKVYHSVCMYV